MVNIIKQEIVIEELNTPATTVPVGRANGAVKPLK